MKDKFTYNFTTLMNLPVADCGSLDNPTDGTVTLGTNGWTTEDEEATYSCNTGYNLNGQATVTCLDTGEWNADPATCTSE